VGIRASHLGCRCAFFDDERDSLLAQMVSSWLDALSVLRGRVRSFPRLGRVRRWVVRTVFVPVEPIDRSGEALRADFALSSVLALLPFTAAVASYQLGMSL